MTGEAKLIETAEGLTLSDGKNAVRGDFTRLLPRIRRGNLASEHLVRAVKIKGIAEPLVVDATAGLGEDAFLLAAAGCRVLLFERDPVIAALLRDAFERAKADPETAPIASRLTLRPADSIPAHLLEKPCEDERALLDAALAARPKRIVIKRPAKGPFLAGVKPSYSLDGSAVRFDCIVP